MKKPCLICLECWESSVVRLMKSGRDQFRLVIRMLISKVHKRQLLHLKLWSLVAKQPTLLQRAKKVKTPMSNLPSKKQLSKGKPCLRLSWPHRKVSIKRQLNERPRILTLMLLLMTITMTLSHHSGVTVNSLTWASHLKRLLLSVNQTVLNKEQSQTQPLLQTSHRTLYQEMKTLMWICYFRRVDSSIWKFGLQV